MVRQALMYGAETRALKKAQETKLEVAEMRMLRWLCEVTKLDKIRNERIRGTTKRQRQRSMYDDVIIYIIYYGPQRRMYDDVMWYYKM